MYHLGFSHFLRRQLRSLKFFVQSQFLGLVLLEFLELLGTILFCLENSPHHRCKENSSPEIKREFHRIRNHAFRSGIGDIEPVGHHPGQERADERCHANEKRLHGKAFGALLGGQHVTHKGTEGFHGNVD